MGHETSSPESELYTFGMQKYMDSLVTNNNNFNSNNNNNNICFLFILAYDCEYYNQGMYYLLFLFKKLN